MSANWSAEQRRRLAEDLASGAAPRCPECDAVLKREPVAPREDVAYVRHRVLLICPACRGAAAVDVRADGPP